MIEHARRVTDIFTVAAVIGGFHLRVTNTQTSKTIEYLKDLHFPEVMLKLFL